MSTAVHCAYVFEQPGSRTTWIVRCDLCDWLEDLFGQLPDRDEAERKAKNHANDPDGDAMDAIALFFQAGKEFNDARAEERRREFERDRDDYGLGGR